MLLLRTVALEPLTKELVFRDPEEHDVNQILSQDVLATLMLEHPYSTHYTVTASDGCYLHPIRKFADDWRTINLLRFALKSHYLANIARLEI